MPLDASEWHVHRALDATEWHSRASQGRRPGDATMRRLGWREGVCGTPAYQSPPRRSRSLVRMRDATIAALSRRPHVPGWDLTYQ